MSGVNSFSRATLLGGVLVTSYQAHQRSAVWVAGITSLTLMRFAGTAPTSTQHREATAHAPVRVHSVQRFCFSFCAILPDLWTSQSFMFSHGHSPCCAMDALILLWRGQAASVAHHCSAILKAALLPHIWLHPYFSFQFDRIYFPEVRGWPKPGSSEQLCSCVCFMWFLPSWVCSGAKYLLS